MYNNYNPYSRPYEQPYTQVGMNIPNIPQNVSNVPRNSVQSKLVDSLEVAKNSGDYPLDGSINYFIVADGSAIVSKQFTTEGISKVVVFKPITEETPEVKYVTSEELDKVITSLNLDDIEEELREIRKQIKKKGE